MIIYPIQNSMTTMLLNMSLTPKKYTFIYLPTGDKKLSLSSSKTLGKGRIKTEKYLKNIKGEAEDSSSFFCNQCPFPVRCPQREQQPTASCDLIHQMTSVHMQEL